MMKELIVSVLSGVIVALILQIFTLGRRAEPRNVVRAQSARVEESRRRSFAGGLMRFILAVAGGIGLAYAAAPFVLRSARHHSFGGIEHGPMLGLTVVATLFVWLLLSSLTRR
jgi:hypothetical protein